MPVFHRVQDGVMTVTVDGDFTADELTRKSNQALEARDPEMQLGILLDISGAAGAAGTPVSDLTKAFVDHPSQVSRIAVLGTQDDTELGGVPIKGFYRRAEALDWLEAGA